MIRRKRLWYTAAVLGITCMMTGCGTKLYELTEQEQQLIVDYSAYAVSKYNIYQSDGMNDAVKPVEDTEKKDEVHENSEKNTEEGTAGISNDKADKVKNDKQAEKVSLSSAIGYDNLEVTYLGLSTVDTYKEGNYYSMEAGTGKKFAVMRFALSNKTEADIEADLFTNAAQYQMTADDGKEYTAAGTFLTYSLTTYQGTIGAGEKVEVVLLFKVPQETKCEDVVLKVVNENVKKIVEI